MTDSVELESVRTEILVAWIFSLLTIIFLLIGFLWYVALGFMFVTAASWLYGSYLAFIGSVLVAPFFVPGLIFFVLMIPAGITFGRISRMRNAANAGDVDELKRFNSEGWAVVALIFSGIIPGIMLLIAYSPIERLTKTVPAKAESSSADLERLSKLKALLDSGVIAKQDFESQKSAILGTAQPEPPTGTVEAQLALLKNLHESGAITDEEYNRQKTRLLSTL